MNQLKDVNLINPIPFGCWQEYFTAKNKIKDWSCQHWISNSLDVRENSEIRQLIISINNFEIKNKLS